MHFEHCENRMDSSFSTACNITHHKHIFQTLNLLKIGNLPHIAPPSATRNVSKIKTWEVSLVRVWQNFLWFLVCLEFFLFKFSSVYFLHVFYLFLVKYFEAGTKQSMFGHGLRSSCFISVIVFVIVDKF